MTDQLGQLNLNWDKRNVYEMDVRVHFLIRGPGIAPNSTFDFPATNVDLAPTLLGMAGLDPPAGMDGKSFLPLLVTPPPPAAPKLPLSVQRHLDSYPLHQVHAEWRSQV